MMTDSFEALEVSCAESRVYSLAFLAALHWQQIASANAGVVLRHGPHSEAGKLGTRSNSFERT